MNSKRIVIAGGSGFIGTALAREFARRQYEVVVLTRTPRQRTDGVREIAWDGEHPGGWTEHLEAAEAVVNLTGKNVNCPHTPENLRAIRASRVHSVNALAAAVAKASVPPKVWIQAGAIGFYGDTKDNVCNEDAPKGADPLAEICHAWESAFTVANAPYTRKVILRIGFVLGRDGGALPVLSRLTKFFLGGPAGDGRQYVSWVHHADLLRMFVAITEQERFFGTFNAVAPHPVTNEVFMESLRAALRRPNSPRVPEFAVRLGARLMGAEPTLALTSSRCTPERLLASEFKFKFPELEAALRDLCRKEK